MKAQNAGDNAQLATVPSSTQPSAIENSEKDDKSIKSDKSDRSDRSREPDDKKKDIEQDEKKREHRKSIYLGSDTKEKKKEGYRNSIAPPTDHDDRRGSTHRRKSTHPSQDGKRLSTASSHHKSRRHSKRHDSVSPGSIEEELRRKKCTAKKVHTARKEENSLPI